MTEKKKASNIEPILVIEKKQVSKIVTVLAALVIVALVVLGGILFVYVQQKITLQDRDNEIASLQNQLTAAKLVSVGFQYTDNRSNTKAPFLHITGYVVNVGSTEATNCSLSVTAVQSGNVTAIDTSAPIPSLDAGAYETINLQFPYTGQALFAYTTYLAWTN